jgi:KEOPS complex subunit Cgi121
VPVPCAGASIAKGESGPLLQRALAMEEEVLLMDADMVCGVDHLVSAVMHARRAFERGSNSSKTLGMEVMLYASGERQISKAKRRMGVHQGTERVAVVLLSPEGDMDLVLEKLGLCRQDSLLDCTWEKGKALGLDPLGLGTLGPRYLQEMVLEKVAFVDLLKR